MIRFPVVFSMAVGIAFTMFQPSVCAAKGSPKLSAPFREWLEGPASYLITKTERAAFLNLKTDDERTTFVERFWEVRNPAPGTGTNEFKDEFFRRIAWVNAFYGRDAGTDGWRTARGRTYILFGRPQSTSNFTANQELYPIELWFYSNPGLSELPSFFYVIFYEKEGVGGYTLYHPYIDGPERLVRSGLTKAQAYRYLRNINTELARATLSLVPGEPVDTETYAGSMSSMQIINAIQGYNHMPSYVHEINLRQARFEVDYDLPRTSLATFVSWINGAPWLQWHVEIHDPGQKKVLDNRIQYDVTAKLYSNGRFVLERTDSPGFSVAGMDAESVSKRPWAYEDQMPVVPGKYRLSVVVQNKATGRNYEMQKEFNVPAPSDGITLGEVLVLSKHAAERRNRPFQFGGVKFFPAVDAQVQAARGIEFLYQLIIPEPRPENVDVEYVIGSVASKTRKTFEDKLDLKQLDPYGSLVTARTLPLDEFTVGAHQLVVRVTDSRTGKLTAQSAAFMIVPGEPSLPPVQISRDRPVTEQWIGAAHYERALCWLAQDKTSEAISALEDSWKLTKNSTVEGILQNLYKRTKRAPGVPIGVGPQVRRRD